jgi:hypothetical protein
VGLIRKIICEYLERERERVEEKMMKKKESKEEAYVIAAASRVEVIRFWPLNRIIRMHIRAKEREKEGEKEEKND